MEKIPTNICSYLIIFLDLEDILNCHLLNKHWNSQMNKKNENFWRFAVQSIPNYNDKLVMLKKIKPIENYFEIFRILKASRDLK